MLKNYFITALRSIRKNKLTTIINVLGLSIGISAALIILMIIEYEFSFDKYEPGKENIYRIVTDGDGWKNPGVPVPLYQNMQNISGIKNTAQILQYNGDQPKISIPQGSNKAAKVFKSEEHVVFANKDYFSLFPHTWLAGNRDNALKDPYSIVLSESYAKRYFSNSLPAQLIGKTVVLNDTILTTIIGVVKDLQENSDFEYKLFISLATVPAANLKQEYSWEEWNNTSSNFQTIIQVDAGIQPMLVSRQIEAILKQHRQSADDNKTNYRLQPLSDVHTNTDYDGRADVSTIHNLILLAVFLLLLGAINFINLSTAQATQRAKEIGIRKTLGSKKGQLITQFLSETLLVTLFTAFLSIAITPLILKAFSGFIPQGLQFSYLYNQPVIWLSFVLLIIIITLVAGLYPAFILTKFQPVAVLKNNIVTNSGVTRSAWMRKALIVFQFIIAQIFIIGVLVVNKQIHFSIEKDMGFKKDAIINFYVPFDFAHPNNKKFVLKEELTKIAGVQEVSLGNQSPAFNGRMSTQVTFKEKDKDLKLSVDSRNGDTAFLSVYNIPLIAGRNINPSDSATEFLINETLAKQLGFQHPADVIGHFLQFDNKQIPVVGVMKDFNLASVRSAINPVVYYAAPNFGYVMHVALQPDPATWKNSIHQMEAAWKNIYPDTDFDYSFLDKKIETFYKADQELSGLLTWAAAVAIFISCIGLLGLVIFVTNSRVKEIGVRKILGATVTQIVALLSIDFVKLVVIAFVIAIPVAWWTTHNWLQNFAYHTELSWWIFLLSGILMLAAALAILSIRAGRAALANPVKSLRTE